MLLKTKIIGGVIAASCILAGAGAIAVNNIHFGSDSVTCNASTGDTISVTSDYKMQSSGDEFAFTKGKDTVMTGILLSDKDYTAYFDTAYTDGACKIIDKGKDKGLEYIYYTYTKGDDITYEYLGWIVGSNTGVLLEGGDSKSLTSNVFDTVSVSVKDTEKDNDYVYTPEKESQDKEDVKVGGDNKASSEDSSAWDAIGIKIDGKEFKYPYSYKELKELGWSFDSSDYTDNGSGEYIVNAGERTSQIELNNEDYGTDDNDAHVSVTFINSGEDAADISDCDINSISISAVYGFDEISKYPDIELAGGIHFGSSEEEIRKAYGEPSDVYKGTYYTELTYNSDNSRYMTLYIYKDKGLLDVELKGL